MHAHFMHLLNTARQTDLCSMLEKTIGGEMQSLWPWGECLLIDQDIVRLTSPGRSHKSRLRSLYYARLLAEMLASWLRAAA